MHVCCDNEQDLEEKACLLHSALSVKSRSADAMQMPAPTMGLLPMLSDGTKTCSAKPFPWHLRSHTINTRKC